MSNQITINEMDSIYDDAQQTSTCECDNNCIHKSFWNNYYKCTVCPDHQHTDTIFCWNCNQNINNERHYAGNYERVNNTIVHRYTCFECAKADSQPI